MMAGISPAEVPLEQISKTVSGLPPGWRREVVVRKNGQSAGKTDVYYYSPCGKKFRSKPQIARFLGDAADLTVFDFSRAGTPGDGSSRRRARDRSARRAVEVMKGPPPIRPLTINPLRPSGPIRRTCGVIKLPVTWVPAPCEDELKLCALVKVEEAMDVDQPLPPPPLAPAPTPAFPPAVSPPAAAVTGGQSQLQPTDQPKPQVQPQPQTQPQIQALAPLQAQAPLQALPQAPPQAQPPVPPKPTSVVMVPALWENRLRGIMVYDYETGNEIKISPEKLQNGLSHSSSVKSEEGPLSLEKSTLSALRNKQLLQQAMKIEDKKHLSSSVSAGSIIPSLLAHGKNVSRPQGVLVPSLKTIKENGSLIATPQQNTLHGGNIVLTLPTLASASSMSYKAAAKPGVGIGASAAQQRNIRTTLVPGSGHAMTTASPGPSVAGLYVSESELRRQEEKVQLLRKQIMAARSTI